MCIGHASPRPRLKKCDESSMHMHLVVVVFLVTSISSYSWYVMGATIQITRLYNSGVEQLKNEEDWPCIRPAFTCDIWKSMMNKKFFACTAHWVREKLARG